MKKIKSFTAENFMAFATTPAFEFCSGINVLIGANSTGKTSLLKAIYSTLKICENIHQDGVNKQEKADLIAENTLMGVFKPDTIGRLIHRQVGCHTGRVELCYSEDKFGIDITSKNNVRCVFEYNQIPNPEKAIFLPVHEALSFYKGFAAAYLNREMTFDQTYFDLAIALSANPLKGPKLEEIKKLIKPLQSAISGAIITMVNDQFYINLPTKQGGNKEIEAHLAAEGYLKVGGLLYLLNNGSLTQNGILFWDEPEANLNPRMITRIVEALKILAESGMQIFVATHDFLLSQEISQLSERNRYQDVRFFALYTDEEQNDIFCETGNSLVEIENNPILDEFAAYYDREAKMMLEG